MTCEGITTKIYDIKQLDLDLVDSFVDDNPEVCLQIQDKILNLLQELKYIDWRPMEKLGVEQAFNSMWPQLSEGGKYLVVPQDRYIIMVYNLEDDTANAIHNPVGSWIEKINLFHDFIKVEYNNNNNLFPVYYSDYQGNRIDRDRIDPAARSEPGSRMPFHYFDYYSEDLGKVVRIATFDLAVPALIDEQFFKKKANFTCPDWFKSPQAGLIMEMKPTDNHKYVITRDSNFHLVAWDIEKREFAKIIGTKVVDFAILKDRIVILEQDSEVTVVLNAETLQQEPVSRDTFGAKLVANVEGDEENTLVVFLKNNGKFELFDSTNWRKIETLFELPRFTAQADFSSLEVSIKKRIALYKATSSTFMMLGKRKNVEL